MKANFFLFFFLVEYKKKNVRKIFFGKQKRQTSEQNSIIQQTLVSYLCVALIIFRTTHR